MFSCWALSWFAPWDELPYALGSWLPHCLCTVWLLLEHGLELLSYGNDCIGCSWCISGMLHMLICVAELWVHADPEAQNHPYVHNAFISVHNSQTLPISFNRAMIIVFVSISLILYWLDFGSRNAHVWLWVRVCGVHSGWVHTEASFMPYHTFPPNPFFDWLLVHFLLPLPFPFRETFK